MTSTDFHKANRQKLLKSVKDAELIVIAGHSSMQASADRTYPFVQDSSFFYLTGLNESGLVLVLDGDEEYLIVPERSAARVAFEGATDVEKLQQTSGIRSIYQDSKGWQKLSRRLQTVKAVGVMKQAASYFESIDMFANPSRQRLIDRLLERRNTLELIDLRQNLAYLRMIKNDYEINMIRQAIKHTANLFEIMEKVRQEATSEADLLAEISRQSIIDRLQFAYDPVIASGLNAVTLHYSKNNAPLDKTNPLLLDVGVACGGYAADITRTVSFAPTKRQQDVYNAVADIQSQAISLLKPGTVLKDYEKTIVELMAQKLRALGLIKQDSTEGIRQFYPHSTSHFLGLDVHDAADYDMPLKAGMVLTVEPGIYIQSEKIGVRIEDDILITENGCQILTNQLPHNLASLTIAA